MEDKDLKRLRTILDKLSQKDVDFLRNKFGIPYASGIIPLEHIRVCYWSAGDVLDYCYRQELDPPSERKIREILQNVQDGFDASIGMDWDIFDDYCRDVLRPKGE